MKADFLTKWVANGKNANLKWVQEFKVLTSVEKIEAASTNENYLMRSTISGREPFGICVFLLFQRYAQTRSIFTCLMRVYFWS